MSSATVRLSVPPAPGYRRWLPMVAAALPVVALVWIIVSLLYVPVVNVFRAVFFESGRFSVATITRLAGSARVVRSLRNTFVMAVITVVTVNIVGLLQIAITDYFDIRGARLLRLAFFTPLIYGGVALVGGYRFVYSSDGVLTRLLVAVFPRLNPDWFEGFAAVLFVHTFAMTMYHIVFVRNELRRIDFSTVEAAKSLGASDLSIFTRIVLPVIKPSIFAASLMVFLAALGSFAAPAILGGRDFEMINTMIRTLASIRRQEMAALLALVLGLASFGLLMLFRAIEKRGHYTTISKVPTTIRKVRVRNPALNITLHAIGYLLFLIYAAPVILVIAFSFAPSVSIIEDTIPRAFTLMNYIRVLTREATRVPLWNSIRLAFTSVLIAVSAGTLASIVIHKWRSRLSALLEFSLFIPWVVPASMLAVGFILSYSGPSPLMAGQTLVGGVAILPLAYAVISIPFALRMIRASLYGLDPNLEFAARSLGAGRYYTFRRVTLPLILPTVLSVSAIMFNSTLSEYTVSALLYNLNNKPLGIALQQGATSTDAEEIAVSLVYVVLLMLFSATTIALTNRYASPGAQASRPR